MVGCVNWYSVMTPFLICALVGMTTQSNVQIRESERNELENGPLETERMDHVMGEKGETAEAIKREQRILKEERSVDIEKYSDDKVADDVEEQESKKYFNHQLPQKRTPSTVDAKECLKDLQKALKSGKNPYDLPCVLRLLGEESKGFIGRRGVFLSSREDGKNPYWPRGVVPYVMDGLNTDQKMERYQAHRHIEMWSCIRFKKRTTETEYVRHIVTSGCSASVGMSPGEGQGQAVACCGGEACVHEYGHSLGLHHEQLNMDHYNFTRFNYGDIKTESINVWTPVPKENKLWKNEDYDLGSIMHYKPWHNQKSHRSVVTVLDPEQRYLLFDSDHTHYGMFKTLSKIYQCQELFCPKQRCHYGGYATKIRDRCSCRCPEGRDPNRRCTAIYKGDSSPANSWPSSAMGILKSTKGRCPSGLWESTLKLATKFHGNSKEYSTGIQGAEKEVIMTFCTKTRTYGNTEWGSGSYCIFRVTNTCPKGFKSGSFSFDSVTRPTTSGSTPSNTMSGTTVQILFCCRNDGLHQDPIRVPSTVPFVMPKTSGKCQEVLDMVSFTQKVTIGVKKETWERKQGHVPKYFQYGSAVVLDLCYYAPVSIGRGQSQIIKLDSSKKVKTIHSPTPYREGVIEYFLIQSPENTTIKLQFDDFNVETTSDGSSCLDYMELFYFKPGQEGVRYCGKGLGKTFISQTNMFNLKFVNALTFDTKEAWKFKFTVELIEANDFCYTGNGETYTGTKAVTRHYEPCLPWSAVKDKCIRDPYDQRYFDSLLESNYCRNPGQGTRPWCYTAIDGCRRDYCDVCNFESCYDVDAKCTDIIRKNPSFCSEDVESRRMCRKTCNHCGDTSRLKTASQVRCRNPPAFPDAIPLSTLKGSYALGEIVTFKCRFGEERQDRMCTTGGWTGGKYVCGRCSSGWTPFEDTCYKFYLHEVPFEVAVGNCQREGATLVTIKTKEIQEFVNKLRGPPFSYWVGIQQCNPCTLPRKWIDGTDVQWSNYRKHIDNIKYKQVYVLHSGKWDTNWYDSNRTYICQKPIQKEPVTCEDQISTCVTLLTANPKACMTNPDFRRFQCARTCGYCRERGDKVRCRIGKPRPVKAEVVIHKYSSRPRKEKVGGYYEFRCLVGHALLRGDLLRACLNDGKLTGSRPVCKPNSDVTTSNNDIELLSRQEMNGWYGYMQVMDNTMMRAHKSGIIQKISYFSLTESRITFLILRRNYGNSFKLLHTMDVRSGFKRIINADVSNRAISLQQGDYLGFYLPQSAPVTTHDRCISEIDRAKHDGYMYSNEFIFPSDVVTGNSYTFKTADKTNSCRINSIKLWIK